MEISKKKINSNEALSIFFSSIIFIYFLYGFFTNENSAGAGPYDFELIWSNLQLLKNNTFSNLDSILYNDSRPPLSYIIHIYLNPLISNKENFRLSTLLISLLVPIIFFFSLKINYKNFNNYLLLLFTSIIMLSPYFRTTAFWGLGENYGLICVLSSYLIYSKIIKDKIKRDNFKNYLLILLICFFSSLCVYFDQKLLFIPILILFYLLKSNLNLRLKISSLVFFSIFSIPFLYLIYIWGSILPPNATFARGFGFKIHPYNLGYCLTIISFYLIPFFLLRKNILYEIKHKLINRNLKIVIFLMLIYIFLLLMFGNFETLPNLGKGIIHKSFLFFFKDINLRLFFTLISFILSSVVIYCYISQKIDFSILLFFLLISLITFPFQQEYLDPLIYLLAFTFFRTKLELNFRSAYFIFAYFASFSISSKIYYLTLLS